MISTTRVVGGRFLWICVFQAFVLIGCQSGSSSHNSTPDLSPPASGADSESAENFEASVAVQIDERDPLLVSFEVLNEEEFNSETFVWDFGDGTESQEPAPTHRYEEGGSITFVLYYENPEGQEMAFTGVLELNNPPQISIADVTPLSGTSGMGFSFRAQLSDRDSQVNPAELNWGFGDGNSAFGAQVEHLYEIEGDYIVTVTYRDDRGAEVADQTAVTVRKEPQTVTGGGTVVGPDNEVEAETPPEELEGSQDNGTDEVTAEAPAEETEADDDSFASEDSEPGDDSVPLEGSDGLAEETSDDFGTETEVGGGGFGDGLEEVGDPADAGLTDLDQGPLEEPGVETPLADDSSTDSEDPDALDPVLVVATGEGLDAVVIDFESPYDWIDGEVLTRTTAEASAYKGTGALQVQLTLTSGEGVPEDVLENLRTVVDYFSQAPQMHVRWYQVWSAPVTVDLSQIRQIYETNLLTLEESLTESHLAFLSEVIEKIEASGSTGPSLDGGTWYCFAVSVYRNSLGEADGSLIFSVGDFEFLRVAGLQFPAELSLSDSLIPITYSMAGSVESVAETTWVDELEFRDSLIPCE